MVMPCAMTVLAMMFLCWAASAAAFAAELGRQLEIGFDAARDGCAFFDGDARAADGAR